MNFWEAREAALAGKKVKIVGEMGGTFVKDAFTHPEVDWNNEVLSMEWERVEETVSKLDEVPVRNAVTNLPPEPIPGQLYRTQHGKKVLYVGKATERWIYQMVPGDILTYDKPYMYNPTSCEYDIIAPWVEPLPAMEIKRWAVVVSTQWGQKGRGFVLRTTGDKESAKETQKTYHVDVDTEIVELTGTLPAK
jgi:hypothetical protein